MTRLAVDPTNPQTWNRYAYVANNPLSFVDPLGLQLEFDNDGCVWDEEPSSDGTGVVDTLVSCATGGGPGTVASGGGTQPGGGGGGGGGGSIWQRIKNLAGQIGSKLCSAVPDVSQIGAGGDFALVGGFGGQLTLNANGNSGEFSLSVSGGADEGVVAPDAYVLVGAVPKAPNNRSLEGISLTLAGAGSRTGGQITWTDSGGATPTGYAVTAGPSLSPVTINLQITGTKNLFTIPYLGYFLNSDRAVCKAAQGG